MNINSKRKFKKLSKLSTKSSKSKEEEPQLFISNNSKRNFLRKIINIFKELYQNECIITFFTI